MGLETPAGKPLAEHEIHLSRSHPNGFRTEEHPVSSFAQNTQLPAFTKVPMDSSQPAHEIGLFPGEFVVGQHTRVPHTDGTLQLFRLHL
jgi:hypothetical protein